MEQELSPDDLSVVEPGPGPLIIECKVALNREQMECLVTHLREHITDRKVLVLEHGVRVARPYAEDLARIERKLDVLVAALAQDDADDTPVLDLDGNVFAPPKPKAEPL